MVKRKLSAVIVFLFSGRIYTPTSSGSSSTAIEHTLGLKLSPVARGNFGAILGSRSDNADTVLTPPLQLFQGFMSRTHAYPKFIRVEEDDVE